MEIFETAAAQMALLFAMIAVGFGCRKKGVMNDEFDAKLSSLVLNVTMPCMIVAAVRSRVLIWCWRLLNGVLSPIYL